MNVSETYEPLRLLLQDLDSTVRRFPDATLAAAVRTCLTLQKVPTIGLTPDHSAFTPDPTVNEYALILLHTAKLFVQGQPDRYSFKTRAFAESFGGQTRDWLWELNNDIFRLENGTLFLAWQDMYSWFKGNEGLPPGFTLTALTVRAPFDSVTLSASGVQ